MQHGNGSAGSIIANGRSYPRRTVQTCLVCSSAFREEVERALLRGDPPRLIAGKFPASGLTPRNVADHFRNRHVAFDDAVRDLLAKEAEERGRALGDAAHRKAAHVRLAEAVLERTLALMEANEVQPKVADGIAAASLLGRYAPPDEDDRPDMFYVIAKVISTVKKYCSPEQWASVTADVRASGVTRLLDQEHNGDA